MTAKPIARCATRWAVLAASLSLAYAETAAQQKTPERPSPSAAATPTESAPESPTALPTVRDAAREADASEDLTPEEWREVDLAVDRALIWLASQQQLDGSFATLPTGQPGVTSLCVMAFLAHGHGPGDEQYGRRIERAIDYILSCQKENGLVSLYAPDGPQISRRIESLIGVAGAYNHAISSLTLSELYGMSDAPRNRRTEAVIERALQATLEMQRWPKASDDQGGWRYIVVDSDDPDSDLSVTGWHLMFLRSARNAGFDVPKEPIDNAVAYVRRCFSSDFATFQYSTQRADQRSRGMSGAGILALAHAGYHNSDEAQRSGDWILQHRFDEYNVPLTFDPSHDLDRYHYGLLNCCQAMYQLGGRHWREFFPPTVNTLLANQQADGSWAPDSHRSDGPFGSAYTTSLVVLSLGAPNQLLPIFQR